MQEYGGFWLQAEPIADGSVVMAGNAYGDWSGVSRGEWDFMASAVDVDGGDSSTSSLGERML